MSKVISVRKKELQKLGYLDFKDWIKNPNNVYIGRFNRYVDGTFQSKWCNPFSAKKYGREECIQMFEKYIKKNKELMSSLDELNDKTLGCWCHPEKCHGDVLIKLVQKNMPIK